MYILEKLQLFSQFTGMNFELTLLLICEHFEIKLQSSTRAMRVGRTKIQHVHFFNVPRWDAKRNAIYSNFYLISIGRENYHRIH